MTSTPKSAHLVVTVSESLKDHFIASGKYGEIGEFTEQKPIAALTVKYVPGTEAMQYGTQCW